MKSQAIKVVIGTCLILLVPLVAVLFTDEVRWGLFDFLVIGTLLIGSGLTYVFVTSKVNPRYRRAIAVAFIAAVLLIWAELAVGIFGSPFAGS